MSSAVQYHHSTYLEYMCCCTAPAPRPALKQLKRKGQQTHDPTRYSMMSNEVINGDDGDDGDDDDDDDDDDVDTMADVQR